MPFVKGYKQTEEHQGKAKKARFVKYGKGICVVCGEEFDRYSKLQVTCGSKECRRKKIILGYNNLKKDDPIASKALILFSTIRLGKGKKEKSLRILKSALGKKCIYCGEIITLENASVDHKIPRLSSKVYDRKKKKMIFSSEEIKELDLEENLQIISRDCNQMKGDMTHNEFSRLVEFLNSNQDIKEKLFCRLKLTRVFFSKKG